MNKNKKVTVILVSIIFLSVVLAGLFIINIIVEGGSFKSEIKKIEKLDVTKDRFNTRIKSSRDYAVVEKSIKDYLDDCSVTYNDIMSILNSKKLNKILSSSNYKKDGPEFKESLEYIEKLEKKYERLNNKFNNCNKDNNIIKNIEESKLSSYYVSLYEKNMLYGKLRSNLDKSITNSKDSREEVKTTLSTIKEVIITLKNNKDKWEIKKNKISFNDYKLYEKYNELVKKIKK